MGGANQSTCPPPAKSSQPVSSSGMQTNPIRSHENTVKGEIDFHDDVAGFKCAVDSAEFFAAYTPWRSQKRMSDELCLSGNDGSGGHASVTLIPFVDNNGDLQVTTIVKKASIGQSILDLDKLAHYP